MKPEIFPEIGKVYPCFDDGKITPSRLYFVKITNILKYKQCEDRVKRLVRNCQINHDWLFKYTMNPYVVEAISGETEELELIYFLWSYNGFWFGIESWFGAGPLDIDGTLLEGMKNAPWSTSKEKIEEIIKEEKSKLQ